MDIEILGTESLGVRGLCCFVKSGRHRILIDPGIALGYVRFGLLPHPVQIAVDEKIQKKIIERWSQADDIIISHFHGDHTPLTDANPYQLSIAKVSGLNREAKILIKNTSHLSELEKKRIESFPLEVKRKFVSMEENRKGEMTFSKAVPHGELRGQETVMMTRIEEGENVFVHTSDIQLLNEEAVSQVLSWKPNIVLTDGPPLYLSRLSKTQIETAWHNGKKIASIVDVLILDHHLLRSREGVEWMERLSLETGGKVICAADFMKAPRCFLEASRRQLYETLPVPDGWHSDYAAGRAVTDEFVKKYESVYGKPLLKDI